MKASVTGKNHLCELHSGVSLRRSCLARCEQTTAYRLVHILERNEWKTGFNTPLGQFPEYPVMPLGLTNAHAVLQNLVNNVPRYMLKWFVFIYLDNILIFSQSQKEHIQHV